MMNYRYMEPWELENAEAIEIIVDTTKVAWTVNDDVFIYTGDTTEREDGYVHIGKLEWDETSNDPLDDSGHNIERLRDFVISYCIQ